MWAAIIGSFGPVFFKSGEQEQESILKIEKRLQEKHHMPTNRECNAYFSKDLPPNENILTPQINLCLIEEVSKVKTDPVELYQIGIKTIMSYPDNIHQVYTDGSAFKGTINAGCGARIEFKDKTCNELSEPCGTLCGNYEAEIFGLKHALENLKETFENQPQKKRRLCHLL